MGEFQTVVCEFHFFIISPPPLSYHLKKIQQFS